MLFAALYASEGAPIGYIWWALPTKLRAAGMAADEVTALTSVLVLPWAMKFLWAPAVDTLRSPRWGLRSWIVTSQLLMGLTLLPLVGVRWQDHLSLVQWLLLAHAMFAATQDASVDALCIASTPPDQRGSLNGWMQVGMLTSRAVFGGVALVVEEYVGEYVVLISMIACIWFSMALTLFACREHAPAPRNSEAATWSIFARTLGAALSRSSTWLGLGFALIAGAGFEAAGLVSGPMLLDGGVDKARVGVFTAGPKVICMAGGALLGGKLADRLGRIVTNVALVIATALAVAAVALLSTDAAPEFLRMNVDGTPAPGALFVGFGVIYLLIGALTAASYALFMDLTDPALGATQFSAFMAATNMCESWSGYSVGVLTRSHGYPLALMVLAGLSLLALPMLWPLRVRTGERERRPE